MKSQNDKSHNKIRDSIWLELAFEYIILGAILLLNYVDGLPFSLKKSHFISGRLIEFDQDVLVVKDKDNGYVKCLEYDFPVELAQNDRIDAHYVIIRHPESALPGGGGFTGRHSSRSLIIQLKVNGKLVKKYSWYEEHKTMCIVLVILVMISVIHLLILKRIRKKKREKKELEDNNLKNQVP